MWGVVVAKNTGKNTGKKDNKPPKKPDANPGLPGRQTRSKGCPSGYRWDNAEARCVKNTDPLPGDDSARPSKQCPPGTYWAPDVGRCVGGDDPSKVQCPPGLVWNNAKGKCVLSAESKHNCPAGSYWDKAVGACIQGDKPPEAAPVECPEGTHWDGYICAKDTPEAEVPPDAPPPPNCPEGHTAEWNADSERWSCVAGGGDTAADQKHQNDLFAQYKLTLESFGISGADDFLKQAVKEDWNESTFLIKMRESAFYLANPLFAANLNNAKNGKRFMAEGEVIAYGSEAKRLARQFGYADPSDNYVAMGLQGGLSLAEYEHRFQVQQRINQYGLGVGLVYKEIMGVDPSDQDLYEIFDKEISTKDFDDKARRAEVRGRPFTLGLGIRSEAEARALEMLGVNPDEAFSRYQGVAANASRFERLGSIEDLIGQGLPADFGKDLSTQENSLLIRGLVFQDQAALAELQGVTSREIARWKSSGGIQSTQGQLVGLLSDEAKASYG